MSDLRFTMFTTNDSVSSLERPNCSKRVRCTRLNEMHKGHAKRSDQKEPGETKCSHLSADFTLEQG